MTDRFNTIAGWVLFAAIVALGLSILSGMFFSADRPERPEQLGYPIEGVIEEGDVDEGPQLALLLATGSVEAGERSYAKCVACHTIEQGGADGIGPNLYGVMGVPIGQHVAGYAYSNALADHGGEWSYENMDDWLASPRNFAPGTKMSFAGLSNAEERANVILYMHRHGGGPPFPEPEIAEEETVENGETVESEAGTDVQPGGDPTTGAGPGVSPGAEAAGAVAAEQPVATQGTTEGVATGP